MFQTQRCLRVRPTLARVGHGQAGPDRPRLARLVIYSNHGPKRDPAREIPISPTVGQARSARFYLAGRLPGLACDILRSFSLSSSSCGSSSSNLEATTCSLPRAQRCLWVAARCPQAAYEAGSATPLYRDTVGARGVRSALTRRILRLDKCHESWFCIWRLTTKKTLFKTKNPTNRVFFVR